MQIALHYGSTYIYPLSVARRHKDSTSASAASLVTRESLPPLQGGRPRAAPEGPQTPLWHQHAWVLISFAPPVQEVRAGHEGRGPRHTYLNDRVHAHWPQVKTGVPDPDRLVQPNDSDLAADSDSDNEEGCIDVPEVPSDWWQNEADVVMGVCALWDPQGGGCVCTCVRVAP